MKAAEMSRRAGKAAGLIRAYFRYNLKIIFANKFVYFAITAVLFFLLVATIIFFSSDTSPDEGTIYNLLLFPGILLVFYPAVFGIQNDRDFGMLEILFAVPNYRYRVWLVRLILIYLVTFAMMLVLSILSSVIIIPVPVFSMVYQIMFPVFFIGSLSFMLSTILRNGNGAAVVMVVIGLGFWITGGWLEHSRYFLFLNPFDPPSEMNRYIWSEIVLNNRIYLSVGAAVSILWALFNLQKRERLV
ncbi:MAG: hypothetical protein GF417_05120 [Candidatus Latescibacteria bacterium]|nr:hypothetical protein [bacterium]MBD3423800.1 hypothetical protein [Candidatus Latescibacterota bacterium]